MKILFPRHQVRLARKVLQRAERDDEMAIKLGRREIQALYRKMTHELTLYPTNADVPIVLSPREYLLLKLSCEWSLTSWTALPWVATGAHGNVQRLLEFLNEHALAFAVEEADRNYGVWKPYHSAETLPLT
jgi:hypothetical protein